MEPRPRHLGPDYAAQFAEDSVAEAYAFRPVYPPPVFDRLLELAVDRNHPILDLGCGTGDIAAGLFERGYPCVHGVDPSDSMLRIARSRLAEPGESLLWIRAAAENFVPTTEYALVVAAESLHWMDWEQVLPKIASWLSRGSFLALVTGRRFRNLPWQAGLESLLGEFSTNREYHNYDLVEELATRGLYREVGSERASGGVVRQSIEEYVESFHSRNGFSRDRMTQGRARDFDAALRSLVLPFSTAGFISGEVTATLVWGVPGAG